jgi:hypothetical protein
MENPVTLKIDGYKDREVVFVSYAFDRATNVEGQLSGVTRGGKITVKVRAMNDGNPELPKWMTSPNLAKKGSIEFIKTTDGSKMKAIEFEDAYCINFKETWEDPGAPKEGDLPKQTHFEEITMTCRKITLGPVTYELKWV